MHVIFIGENQSFESLGEVCNHCHEIVGGGEAGVGDVSVLEVHGVTEIFTVGGLAVAAVGMVVLWQSIEVPTIDGVECLLPQWQGGYGKRVGPV